MKTESVGKEIRERILGDKAAGTAPDLSFREENAHRRSPERGDKTSYQSVFVRDTERIMACPFYSRCADKTQVFSFYKNDDITRRGLHLQLVSRIARNIGAPLGLNLDLIEAIALGHDVGHTPFAHAGEKYLDELYASHTGRHFSHNIHSVRVLDEIFPYNLTLEVLNGIAAHNGECEKIEYVPEKLDDFGAFDRDIEQCYLDAAHANQIVPATLEACVVRVSDILAYLGKDRKDAADVVKAVEEDAFRNGPAAVERKLDGMIVNLIESSYGENVIRMDNAHFAVLQTLKRDNYAAIYNNLSARADLDGTVRPMMAQIYEKLLKDLNEGNKLSPIYTHHIAYINAYGLPRKMPYEETEANQLVVDYIASMTDDYFIDLYHYLFPHGRYRIEYKGYFD